MSGAVPQLDSIALGVEAVRGLLEKTKLDAKLVDDLIWGNVGETDERRSTSQTPITVSL
jgi:3-hydroxy-3-methylglutaryl CoA synthase